MRLLEALLDFVNYEMEECEHIPIKAHWKDTDGTSQQLVIETKLRALQELTQKDRYEGELSVDQIRESINRMKDFLKILSDFRFHERGSDIWNFSLSLWSKDKTENLKKFQKKWEENRPDKSKREIPKAKDPGVQRDKSIIENKIGEVVKGFSLANVQIFPSSDHHTAIECLKKSFDLSNRLRAYSISLNFLWNEEYFECFKERVISDSLSDVKLCFANPFSPESLLRLSHEGGQPVGLSGIQYRLKQKFIQLESQINDSSRFAVRLFEHYPTYTMLNFDREFYVYLYPFKSRGNTSPTFYWQGESEASAFFQEQFESIWADARPAKQVFSENPNLDEINDVSRVYEGYTINLSVQKG